MNVLIYENNVYAIFQAAHEKRKIRSIKMLFLIREPTADIARMSMARKRGIYARRFLKQFYKIK